MNDKSLSATVAAVALGLTITAFSIYHNVLRHYEGKNLKKLN